MIQRTAAFAAAVMWGLSAGSAQAQEHLRLFAGDEQGPVELHARELSAAGGGVGERIEARGEVVLTWKGYRLTADRVAYDHLSRVAEAEGRVRLVDQGGNVLEGRHLTIDVATEQGSVEDGTLRVADDGYRIWGKKFTKTGPVSYRVEGGGFTACDGTWPSWKVYADRVDVELEGYLKGRGSAFWVEGLPLAYTPYVLFPIKRQRQSGFLLPKVGLSSRDGALFVTRYYWAFADNADLLARLEYRTRRGWTEAGELRYVLAEGHEGRAELSHLSDRLDGSERYTVKVDHDSRFDDVTRVRLHVDYLGDTSYLKDFGDTLDERGRDRLESYFLATRDVDMGTVFGWADYFQALNQPQSEVLQTLPALGVVGRETPLLGPLSWDPTVRLTRFYREDGQAGERLQALPGLAWEASASGVGLGARVGYREQLYRVDGDFVTHGAPRAELSTTATLARPLGGFVHTVEPTIGFAWEERGQGDTPPAFDGQDVFATRADVGFLLESRLLRASDLGEVAALDLGRSLDAGRVKREGFGDAWGGWKGRFVLTPREHLRFRAEGEFDPGRSDPWVVASVTGEDQDSRGDRIFASYRYLRDRAEYVDAGAEVVLAPALALQYRHRYSLRDERTLESGVGLHLTHSCWEVLTSFSRNYLKDEDRYESRYLLTLQLKGLGKLGTMRGIVP